MTTPFAFATVHTSVEAPPRTMLLGVAEKLMTGAASTVTVTCAVAVPPGPVAVSWYVVVVGGDTDAKPETGRLPMPWSIETLMAWSTDHARVALSPSPIVRGDAEKVICGFGGVTVTVTCFVMVPPMPLAVSVYVVVAGGETDRVPLVGTAPTPLSIDALVAFVVVQARDVDSPSLMVVGAAVNVAVGGGTTVIVTCFVTVSPRRASPTLRLQSSFWTR
jgi:hypothetical protein